MKYGFVRLKNDDGSKVYMETRDFERYESYDVFKSHAEALVVFDKIYIGMFPLMFKEDEIYKYNPDAFLSSELSLTDIAFRHSKISTIAKYMDCEN